MARELAADLRAAILANADRTLRTADRFLVLHPQAEADPLVLLHAAIEGLTELEWRIATVDDPEERRIRLAALTDRVAATEQAVARMYAAQRDGIGRLPEYRYLAENTAILLRALRLHLTAVVTGEREDVRRERTTPGGV